MNGWNCNNARGLRQIFSPQHEGASPVDVVLVAAATADRGIAACVSVVRCAVAAAAVYLSCLEWTFLPHLNYTRMGYSLVSSSRIRWEDSWSALFYTVWLRGFGSRFFFLELVRRLRATAEACCCSGYKFKAPGRTWSENPFCPFGWFAGTRMWWY